MRASMLRYFLMCALACSACKQKAEGYDHASEHPEGHDHHESGHGHGDQHVERITLWSEHFELFAEHPPAVVGEPTALLAHVTLLSSFQALTKAQLQLELTGPAVLTASAQAPDRPGIYSLTFTPKAPGKYQGRIVVKGAVEGAIEGIEIEVFKNDAQAHEEEHADEDESGLIEFLKEQQWGVAFATEAAKEGSLVASIEVAGTIETPPDGSAEVGAAIAGRLVAPASGLPHPGDVVKKGQLLSSIAPSPSSPEDAARAGLVAAEAQARVGAAQAALSRAERLLADQAIAAREVEDARRELLVAQESVQAARRAGELFSGSGRGQAFRLTAPIGGTLVSVHATPGAAVTPGDVLFRIVDPRELWIRARIPEQEAARLRTDQDARFQVAGLSIWRTLDISGADANARLVTVGAAVDTASRTVEVIYGLRAPDAALRVGGLVQVSLPTGEEFQGVVLPRSAILDQDGRQVVYVQLDGEHFAQRAVREGPRAGELVGIAQGVAPGERIVTRGAHLVRLADRPRDSAPHGHIH